MRIVSLIIVIILAGFTALVISGGIALPVIEGATGQEVGRWYFNQAVLAAVVGTIMGIVWGLQSSLAVEYKPGESGEEHENRVRIHGLRGLALSAGITICLGSILAALASFIPMGPGSRIGALVLDMRFLGVVACSAAAMGLSWGVTLRVKGRDGARALIP